MAAILETGRVRDQLRAALTLNHHRTVLSQQQGSGFQLRPPAGFCLRGVSSHSPKTFILS